MAPTLRGARFRTPSPEPLANREATTTRKCKFFDALAQEARSKSLRRISKDCGIVESTGRKWKKQLDNMGSLAKRRTRQRSSILGRKSKVSKSTCKMLVSPSRNPVRDQLLEAQIEHHQIPVKKRQLQKKLKEYTNGGQRYKCAFVKKDISKKNRQERATYGYTHYEKTVEDFWSYIFFTDEAHIDPTSLGVGHILREKGKRYDNENIQERGERKGVQFYITAWITWFDKAEKLEFYNDEEDYITQPPMPSKPRRRPTTETKEEFESRVKEWEALKPHPVQVKVGGNAMTQKYYTERLLPIYIEAIQNARLQDAGPWLFQEDGDPSHGIRKEGLAFKLKEEN